MDNDNKVIVDSKEDKIHQEVMLFLGDELNTIHKSAGGQVYEIASEYEKTKKNKSPFALIVIAISLVFIVGIVFFMQRMIASKNGEITVSLEEFTDLNLRTLLDTVSSAQTNYDNAVKNKAQIQADMETKIKNAEEKLENDIFVIDSMNLKYKTVYNDRIAEAKRQYAESIKEIQTEFAEPLALAEKEVEEYKKQLAEFDTAKIEAARNQEKALDSERQLRELETKKLTDKYEKRIAELETSLRNLQRKSTEDIRKAVDTVSKQYQHEIDLLDPTINDAAAKEIISETEIYKTEDFDSEALLAESEEYSEELLAIIEQYQSIYDDYKYLDNVVASIPQKNSIPGYVASARTLVNDMSETFIDTAVEFYEETVQLNNEIDSLNDEIDSLNNKITEMINDFNAEKNSIHASYKNQLNAQKDLYEASIENVLTQLKTNAMVLEGSNYDNIKIYVSPKARYLILEEGAPAEIKLTKGLKGTILRNQDGSFGFEVALDKEGNLPEVDFSLLLPGTSVKILSK